MSLSVCVCVCVSVGHMQSRHRQNTRHTLYTQTPECFWEWENRVRNKMRAFDIFIFLLHRIYTLDVRQWLKVEELQTELSYLSINPSRYLLIHLFNYLSIDLTDSVSGFKMWHMPYFPLYNHDRFSTYTLTHTCPWCHICPAGWQHAGFPLAEPSQQRILGGVRNNNHQGV